MRAAVGFSLLVFAPLLFALLLPALILVPAGILMFLISLFDPTVPVGSSLQYNLWVFAPIVLSALVFLAGIGIYRFYSDGTSRTIAWIALWVVFSVGAFLAGWFGITILTSLGASDYPASQILRNSAAASAGLALLCQPVVGMWLFVSTRMFDQFGKREEETAVMGFK